MIKKTIAVLVVFMFLFTLVGCVSNKGNPKPVNNDPTNGNKNPVTDTKKDSESGSFVPQKAVPQNLPVYPGAILVNDLTSYGDNNWQWLYSTTASGNEIVDFFKTEFQKLGFEIDGKGTFANHEEFFVATTNSVISIYWLSIDELDGKNVNPDTPGRNYGIVVNLDEWNK